jgi:hypothetical protein
MNERPGPDIGPPQRQHQIIAMLWLLSTCASKAEAQNFLAGLRWSVGREWGWDAARLSRELVTAEAALKAYQGRTTFWFTDEGMEFDYHCTPPES